MTWSDMSRRILAAGTRRLVISSWTEFPGTRILIRKRVVRDYMKRVRGRRIFRSPEILEEFKGDGLM